MQSKIESGRSMMEMIGILAIMGIVTYGVLVGINSGMTSYKVNQAYVDIDETIKGIQDMYSTVYGRNNFSNALQCDYRSPGDGICPKLKENGIKYRKMNIQGNGTSFTITYTTDNDKICGRLIQMDWAVLSINCKGKDDIDCKEAKNNDPDHPENHCINKTKLKFSPM